uniref:hypothetical protein n=1 Tax=Pantoea sp. GbtcB22 TaxID=2824767 RepID=UPI001C2F171C
LEMALSALRLGHRVIGTARDVKTASMRCPEFEELGGQWLQLDVSRPETQQILEGLFSVEENHLQPDQTQHWVIVNNAGSSLIGAVEDMSEQQI